MSDMVNKGLEYMSVASGAILTWLAITSVAPNIVAATFGVPAVAIAGTGLWKIGVFRYD